jgi:hypothetical protein
MKDPVGLVRFSRFVGSTRLGRIAAVRGYLFAAAAFAKTLQRVGGVDGVYLTGSLTKPELLRPGYSDIDLVIVADLPTLSDELRLRHELRRALLRANSLGTLFKHLDYMERRDLDVRRTLGNNWSLSLDSTWQLLTGTDRLLKAPSVPPEKRRLEGLLEALRRWQRSSAFLLDEFGGPAVLARSMGARRALASALRAWLGRSTDVNLASLLEEARTRATGADALGALARGPVESAARRDEPMIVDAVVATLEVLEVFANEVTADWRGSWNDVPIRGTVAGFSSEERHSLSGLAEGAGFSALYSSRDRYGRDASFVIARPDTSAESAVECLRAFLRARALASNPCAYPTLLTASLWKTAALLDSSPFTGADLARSESNVWGDTWSAPPRPEGAAWDDLVVGRTAELLWRPRGRSLRAEVEGGQAFAKAAHEVSVTAPALGKLLGLRAGSSAQALPSDERALVERWRTFGAEVRPLLATRLHGARRR